MTSVEVTTAGGAGARRLTVESRLLDEPLPLGASLAVDGVCLTVVDADPAGDQPVIHAFQIGDARANFLFGPLGTLDIVKGDFEHLHGRASRRQNRSRGVHSIAGAVALEHARRRGELHSEAQAPLQFVGDVARAARMCVEHGCGVRTRRRDS